MVFTRKITIGLLMLSFLHLSAVTKKTTNKKTTLTTTESAKKGTSKKTKKTVTESDTSRYVLSAGTESARAPEPEVKNITFLKTFQCSHMDLLRDALIANNNAPFTIVNAFIVQPLFIDAQYDITSAAQICANNGILCLPQNLKAFIGNQGIDPYMYVAKILFTMGGITYNLCYRNDFLSVSAGDCQAEFDAMILAIAPHVSLT